MKRLVPNLVPYALAGVLVASPAAAQTGHGIYVGASAGSVTASADRVDDTVTGVGVVAGWPLRPWLDLEGELIRPQGLMTREYTGTSISFAPPGSSREEFDRLGVLTRFTNLREPRLIGSLGVSFHPRTARRMMPRLFLGVTGHWVEDRTRLEHLRLPPAVSLEQVQRMLPEGAPWRRNVGGLTIGGSLAIALSDTLSIVPDLRYDYGSIGDEINDTVRASARVVWQFR